MESSWPSALSSRSTHVRRPNVTAAELLRRVYSVLEILLVEVALPNGRASAPILNKGRLGRRVLLDGGAAQFVSLEHSERWRIDVNGDEVAAAHVRIAELMNVGKFGAGQAAGAQLAM